MSPQLPWYVAGPMIGLVVPVLLWLGNKPFGLSSSLRHICAACVPAHLPFFNYDWKSELWNLFFVFGILIGVGLSQWFMPIPEYLAISEKTAHSIQSLGIQETRGLMPEIWFSWTGLLSLPGFVSVVIGGFLVGFGTRYGNGCTSGHAITGLSNLQWSSLVATCSFFVGGVFCTHVIIPLLFKV